MATGAGGPGDAKDEQAPQYTKYRARPRWAPGGGGLRDDALGALRRDTSGLRQDGRRKRRLRKPITPWRVFRWVVGLVVFWIVLSLALFLISAQVEQTRTSNDAKSLLSGGFPLTSKSTVLVLGSDARLPGTHEAGASTIGEASRSDSILLIRTGGGASARLSIPRDTVVDIPGHGRQKINAAYAIGGAELAIRTVEEYLGIKINHLVEVDFENFPSLIDALGGIDYEGGCVVSRINGGFKNGGFTLRLKSGTTHIDGKQALALARTRKNECNPAENDLTRARRQQKIFSAMKKQLTSPMTFLRLPWVSWAAPRAIRSDMGGPSLLGLFTALATADSPPTRVLKPSGGVQLSDGGAGLVVSDVEKEEEVRRFLAG